MVRWSGVVGVVACCSAFACGNTTRDKAANSDVPDAGATPEPEPEPEPEPIPTDGRHLIVRPRTSLAGASAAFAGETLGIAATQHHRERYPGDVVVAIDRGSEFSLVKVGVGSFAALAGADDGFHVSWNEPADPSRIPAVVKLAHVTAEGSIESIVDVGNIEAQYARCSIAASGVVVAVICQDLAAICSEGTCTPAALPECKQFGSAAVLWDGQAFAVLRECEESELDTNPSLRYARLSAAGQLSALEKVVDTRSLDPAGGLGLHSDPAVVPYDGSLLVAWHEALYTIDSAGDVLGVPAAFARPRSYTPTSIDYQVIAAEGRILVVDAGCSEGLESSWGDVMLTVLDADLAPVTTLTVVEEECATVALVRSAGGRGVLVRPSPGSLLIEELELQTAARSGTRLVVGPAGEPQVRGMACSGAECMLTVFEPGIEPADPAFPERSVRITIGGEEPLERPLGARCADGCRTLFTPAGDTIISEPPNLSWLDPAGVELWWTPTPNADHTLSLGNGDLPWVGGTGLENAWHWRLLPTGPLAQLLEGPPVNLALHDGAPFFCDDGIYVLKFTADSFDVHRLEETGLAPKLATLPNRNQIVCAAGQFVSVSRAPNEPTISRLLPDGSVLMGENLGAPIVSYGASGSSVVLLLRADQQGPDDWSASQRLVLVELSADGGTRRRELVLPEPGWYGILSNLGYYDFGVQITPEYDHLLYTTESALMLSSYPRE